LKNRSVYRSVFNYIKNFQKLEFEYIFINGKNKEKRRVSTKHMLVESNYITLYIYIQLTHISYYTIYITINYIREGYWFILDLVIDF